MSGFVGYRAKKKRRNIFFTLVFLIIIFILFLIFPSFENFNNVTIPDNNIMPDPYEDLTSLTSNIEELELSLFQKDQKIKFRDGQIKNLQDELKNVELLYESILLEINSIKNNSENVGLISSNNYKSLQEKYTKLNIQNDKNISVIINLNKKIDNLNNNLFITDEEIENMILDNNKLTKDSKSYFANNIRLEKIINDLKKNIKDQKNKINLQLDQIIKLKDKSPHGG